MLISDHGQFQVACNVATGPRPPMTTFTGGNKANTSPVSLDLRDEGVRDETLVGLVRGLAVGLHIGVVLHGLKISLHSGRTVMYFLAFYCS